MKWLSAEKEKDLPISQKQLEWVGGADLVASYAHESLDGPGKRSHSQKGGTSYSWMEMRGSRRPG